MPLLSAACLCVESRMYDRTRKGEVHDTCHLQPNIPRRKLLSIGDKCAERICPKDFPHCDHPVSRRGKIWTPDWQDGAHGLPYNLDCSAQFPSKYECAKSSQFDTWELRASVKGRRRTTARAWPFGSMLKTSCTE